MHLSQRNCFPPTAGKAAGFSAACRLRAGGLWEAGRGKQLRAGTLPRTRSGVSLSAWVWIQVPQIPIHQPTPPLFSLEETRSHRTSNQAHVSPYSWRKLEETSKFGQHDDGQVNYVLFTLFATAQLKNLFSYHTNDKATQKLLLNRCKETQFKKKRGNRWSNSSC